MKLRYKGGHMEKVLAPRDPKFPKSPLVQVDRDQLSQMLEETEYVFPEKGAVLSVPSNVGSWLLGKHKAYLEELPEEAGAAPSQRRLVAVVPSDTKTPEAK